MRILIALSLCCATTSAIAHADCVNFSGQYRSRPADAQTPTYLLSIEQKGCISLEVRSNGSTEAQSIILDGSNRVLADNAQVRNTASYSWNETRTGIIQHAIMEIKNTDEIYVIDETLKKLPGGAIEDSETITTRDGQVLDKYSTTWDKIDQ